MSKALNYFKNLLFSHHFLIKNTFWLYSAEITSRLLHIILFFFIARTLGKEIFGVFSYVLALVSFYFIFSDFGLSQLILRDYQQKENKEEVVKEILAWKIVICLLVSIISFSGYVILKAKEYSTLLYFILILYFFLFSLRGYFTSFFIGINKAYLNFFSSLIEGITILFFSFSFSLFHRSSLAIGLAYLFSSFLATSFSFYFFQRETKINFNEFFKNLRLYLKNLNYYFLNGLPLVFFGLLTYVFFYTDQIIIAHYRTFEELGDYSVASKIILASGFVSYIFSTAIFPFLAKTSADLKKFKKYFYFFLFVNFLISLLTIYLVFLFSPWIIVFGFGKEYLDALPLIYLLMWLLVYLGPTSFLDYVLFAFNKQWLDFIITVIPAILNFILNLFFVPSYGVYGAILASILAQFLNFILTLIFSLLTIEKKI
ncbi:hypothetical protein HRbin35_00256 [bacterium HR35]|nr:hypothetical protein HRbin35_00256 [bacterium HR35]